MKNADQRQPGKFVIRNGRLHACTSVGRKLSAATAERLPLGYFLLAWKRP